MKQYAVEILLGGLPAIDLEDRQGRVVVDTGSPLSFTRSGQLNFMGRQMNLPRNIHGIVTAEYLSAKLETEITGLIGMDLLSNLFLKLDYAHNELTFSDQKIEVPGTVQTTPLLAIDSVPVVVVNLPESTCRAFIDTGAHYSYATPACCSELMAAERITDFHPFYGAIETQLVHGFQYNIDNLHFSHSVARTTGLLTTGLRRYNIDMILGYEFMRSRPMVFEFPDHRLLFC